MKHSELSPEDKVLSREIQKAHPWLKKNQCATIIRTMERDADPVCVCIQTDRNAGLTLYGVKNNIDPATYASEKKEIIAELDRISENLDRLKLQNPKSDIHTKRIAIFISQFVEWQKEAMQSVARRGQAKNVDYIVNGTYWHAPQNAFRLIADLYAPVVDKGEEYAKEIITTKNILTLSHRKNSQYIFADFYSIDKKTKETENA